MDRLDAMKVFVLAVDEGGLAAAGRKLGRSPAAAGLGREIGRGGPAANTRCPADILSRGERMAARHPSRLSRQRRTPSLRAESQGAAGSAWIVWMR